MGFLTPGNILGRVLGIIEGGIGLFAVFYLFTFVPDYIASIRSRENQVEYIYARAGDPPTGVKLVEWYYKTKESGELGSLFEQWENWFRELGETHDTSPTLGLIPSSFPRNSWVKAVLCMLDTANYISCFSEDPLRCQAELCLQAGTLAVNNIAENLKIGGHGENIKELPNTSKEEIESVSLEQKDAKVLITHLKEDFWKNYSENRENYARAIMVLAERTYTDL